MTKSRWRALPVAAVAGMLALAIPGHAQTAAAAKPEVDAGAMAALDKMGAYLRTLKVFRVESRTTRDEVLDDGQKVQVNGTADLIVRRPDGLRMSVETDHQDRMYFYDGKNFTLYAKRLGYYATTPAPATLGQLADVLDKKYDIEIPLADLFTWGTDQAAAAKITAAADVGPSQVEGTSCEHYGFRQEGLDWQVWLQQGSNPLPRKLVLTTTDDEARPEYSSTITWDLAPAYNDAAFTFDPPSDAKRIVFAADRAGK